MNSKTIRKKCSQFIFILLLLSSLPNFVFADAQSGFSFGQFFNFISSNDGSSPNATVMGVPLAELKSRAKDGDGKSLGILAFCYMAGNECEKNVEKAFQFASESHAHGDAYGTSLLGHLYAYGIGTPSNTSKALLIWNTAADKDQSESLVELGSYFLNVQNQGFQPQKGADYFERAAGLGNPYAMYVLGYLYLQGSVRNQNFPESLKWFKKAAELGNSLACVEWAKLVNNGKGTSQNKPKAFQIFSYCAEKLGSTAAMVAVGDIYANGDGVARDLVTAAKWYKKASDGNDVNGMIALAEALLKGEGLPKNPQMANSLLLKCAQMNNSDCMTYYGTNLVGGIGVVKNVKQGNEWLEKAANLNNSQAMFNLSLSLLRADMTKENTDRSLYWMKKSAASGLPEAIAALKDLEKLLKPKK